LEKFLNNITNEKKKLKVHEVETSHISNYHDEPASNYDEETLLNQMNMINQNHKMTRVKWINFRNECLQCVSDSVECSEEFCEKFMKFLYVVDPRYYEENEELLELLKNYVLWRHKMIDIDVVIKSLSNLYQQKRVEKNESLLLKQKLTHQIIDEMLLKHGSSAVVKIRKSFEAICEQSHDHELLYILWTKLFER
jgi:hypothetical protein